MRALKPPKPKRINFELIPEKDGDREPEPYKILREMRGKFHNDLYEARIGLAWRKSLKKDKDGHLMLGMCVKASDFQKELAEWDFVILLNRDVWFDPEFTPERKRALVDHELCHATFAPDKDGFKKRDERDRVVWRTRKHDIEEFTEIVSRHGLYKRDLEAFGQAILKKKSSGPLLEGLKEPIPEQTPIPGTRVVIEIGKKAAPPEASTEERQRTKRTKKPPIPPRPPEEPESQDFQ
jgi:Putative phage metallopeptidase